MRKIHEVLRLRLEQKMSIREVSASCGIGFGTVINYMKLAEAAGLKWPLPEGMTDSSLNALLFPPCAHEGNGRIHLREL